MGKDTTKCLLSYNCGAKKEVGVATKNIFTGIKEYEKEIRYMNADELRS